MTKPSSTEIIIVLDRSGSMSAVAEETVGGLNRLLTEQRAVPGEARITILQFDDKFEYLRQDARLDDVPEIKPAEYRPRGFTALHDAICKAIDEAGARFAQMPESERPSTVMCAIITDGYENASKEFEAHHVQARISKQTKDFNWQFIYLGAGADAILRAGQIGILAGNAAHYTGSPKGMGVAFQAVNSATRKYRMGGVSGQSAMVGMQSLGEEETASWSDSNSSAT